MPENEFDMEAFDAQWNEDNDNDDVEYEDTDSSDDEEYEAEDDNLHEDEETNITQPEAEDESTDEQRRNAAFAQMRRELESTTEHSNFLQQIADENGITVEQMRENYENSRLEEQSEEQGIPMEVLQRLQSLEQENETIKSQTFTERFNGEVNSTIEKYKASDAEIEETFAYARDNGLVDVIRAGGMKFEAVHKAAHLDSLLEKAKADAVQGSLSSKKKRQQQAQLAHGSGAALTDQSMEDRAVADAAKILEGGW